MALATNAPIAPAGLAFQTHHVVSTFHSNICSSTIEKNCHLRVAWSSTQSKGTHPIKMSKVNGETGHEAQSNIEPANAVRRRENRFTEIIFCKNRVFVSWDERSLLEEDQPIRSRKKL